MALDVAVNTLLHNFIQLSLNSGSAQVQTLLVVCQRFARVRSLTMVQHENKAKRLSSVNHTTKTVHRHHHHYHHHHHHHHHHYHQGTQFAYIIENILSYREHSIHCKCYSNITIWVRFQHSIQLLCKVSTFEVITRIILNKLALEI